MMISIKRNRMKDVILNDDFWEYFVFILDFIAIFVA